MKRWSMFAHVIPWIISFIFSFIAVYNTKVDGYQISGFCHISMYSGSANGYGYETDPLWMICLVFIPQCFYIFFYAILIVPFLLEMKNSLTSISNPDRGEQIRGYMKRYGYITLGIIALKIVSVTLVLMATLYRKYWDDSLKDFLSCQMKSMQG